MIVMIRRQWEEKGEEVQETNRREGRRDSGGKQDRSSSKRTVVRKKLPKNLWIPYLLFVIKNNSSPQNSKIIILYISRSPLYSCYNLILVSQ